MIDAFIKALLSYDHIVDCVAELGHARKEGNKVKIMCLINMVEYYNNGKRWRRNK